MKIRFGFVSNSSSTSFIIINKTKKPLKLEEFVKENDFLFDKFLNEYGFHKGEEKFNSKKKMISDAKKRNIILNPGENICTFGDHDGDTLGYVYDYILREGGESKRFIWKFYSMNR